jgi:hypothetical protein
MSNNQDNEHLHVHGNHCGHTGVVHKDHVDFLHDGHLHHQAADGSVQEHVLEISASNPNACTKGHECSGHDLNHVHGPGCGHEAVPHGDHIDYLVDGHLHHPHNGHCDDHGKIELA